MIIVREEAFNGSALGADLPLAASEATILSLLEAFKDAVRVRSDLRLVLASRRSTADRFSVWNYLDEHGLTGNVEFLPYFDVCRRFPVRKRDCALWMDSDTFPPDLTADTLLNAAAGRALAQTKRALFVTGFHPARLQGNGAYARFWVDQLRQSGYLVHVLYYPIDGTEVSLEMRRDWTRASDLYLEVPVTSEGVGVNRNGMNIHVDDWCGREFLEAVDRLARRFSYDVVVVNYAIMSAAFEVLPAYTEKVLLTHDQFAHRNSRLLSEGYSKASWISLDEHGERLACLRSDVVVAIQDEEAAHFERLVAGSRRVCVVSPVIPRRAVIPLPSTEGFRVGFFGSSNLSNETNINAFLQVWARRPRLLEGGRLVLAGGICNTLPNWIPGAANLLGKVGAVRIGEAKDLARFFRRCDVVINPEIGGTGIKIKSLETMAYGAGLLSTRKGSIGIRSESRFHNAEDLEALADLCEEVMSDRTLLARLRMETAEVYSAYVDRNRGAASQILGPSSAMSEGGRTGREVEIVRRATEPLVSIIVPFYGVQEFLGECLETILDQNYRNIEVVLVDDGSPDGSRAIADAFAADDPRVRVISHERNQGLGPARNTGARYARGEYLFFLDADDYLLSVDVISRLINTAIESGCDVTVGSDTKVLSDRSFVEYDHYLDRGSKNRNGEVINGTEAFTAGLRLPGPNYLPMRAWGMLIKGNFYRALALDFPAGEHEDMAHTPFLYFSANGVRYVRGPFIAYRIREGSISNARWTTPKIDRYCQLWRRMDANLERFGLQRYRSSAALTVVLHLFWKLQTNGFDPECPEAALRAARMITREADALEPNELWFNVVAIGRSIFVRDRHDFAKYAMFADAIPGGVLLAYYRREVANATPSPD